MFRNSLKTYTTRLSWIKLNFCCCTLSIELFCRVLLFAIIRFLNTAWMKFEYVFLHFLYPVSSPNSPFWKTVKLFSSECTAHHLNTYWTVCEDWRIINGKKCLKKGVCCPQIKQTVPILSDIVINLPNCSLWVLISFTFG